MEIHLARDGSSLGIFTETEVREGLAAGKFSPSDLAWRHGMATWIPLAEWPEFAGAGVPVFAGSAPVPASEIPWEQSHGLGSLFRTLGLALTASRKLATGRFEAGGSFGLAYAAIAVGFIPLLLIAILSSFAQEGQQEALLALIGDRDGPFFDGVRESLAQSGDGVAYGIPAALCGAVFLPLIAAFLGMLEWTALRITGAKLAFGRSVMASMSLRTLVAIGLLPIALLTGALGLALPLTGLAGDLLGAILSLVILALALGRALGLNPWRVVLAWLIIGAILACCVCGCAGIIGLVSAAA